MVVSWNTAEDARIGQGGVVGDDGPPRRPATASVNDDHPPSMIDDDDGGPVLFHLARNEKWEELIDRLNDTSPDVIREQTDPVSEDEEEKDSILHIVAVMESVPVKVVETILDRTSSSRGGRRQQPAASSRGEQEECVSSMSSLAAKQNHLQQTPLHLAVVSMPERTDVIERLYQACPESVHARDALRLRAIDIITQKIIMMEEVIKYSRRNEEEECQKMLNCLWKTVRVLVGATTTSSRVRIANSDISSTSTAGVANNSDNAMVGVVAEPTFLVHACLRTKEIPFALTERAMKHNQDQLAAPDVNGDLPLHVVARIPPPVKGSSTAQTTSSTTPPQDDEDGEENDEDEGDFLERVIHLYPNAAFHFNNEQQIPLTVAIQSGRRWNSGISLLLQVNPSGIEEVRFPLNVFPFLLELLCKQPSTMYQVLQSQPGLFLYSLA